MRITILDTEVRSRWNHDTGNPGVMLFANAVQVWAIAQDRPVTAKEAAASFNVDPDLVREAVEEHPWMFLTNDVIEHEGE